MRAEPFSDFEKWSWLAAAARVVEWCEAFDCAFQARNTCYDHFDMPIKPNFRQIDRSPWRNEHIRQWVSDLTDGRVRTVEQVRKWWETEATDEARSRLRSAARGVAAQTAHSINQLRRGRSFTIRLHE